MSHEKFTLFVDGDRYEWDFQEILGEQLRELAGIPQNAEIFLKVSGKPDERIHNQTIVNLKKHEGPARFSTQSPGSQAG
jgi:hypothetical protein